jgi:hypothetical protein
MGERPDGPLCPLVWSEDGHRGSTENYPRGFATRWARARKSDINEYDVFAKSLAEAKVAQRSG